MKLYRARKSAEVTPRYFVDRFPIFLNRSSAPPLLTFTYVDSGAVTLDGFATHLRAYLGLIQALRGFEFLYIAPTTRLFQAAESEFHHVLYGRREQSKCLSLLEYFRVRKAWDAKERVTSADVVSLKEAQERYVGRKFEELYERWRKGTAKDADVIGVPEQHSEAARGGFRALVCGSSLRIFTDPLGITVENSPEADLNDSLPQVSGTGSVQVSGS